ncbi:YchJ family protein [Cognatilysobacter bugurensis]|uniref:UPF0225 protein GCM10007067_26960 n=1 Tax=Cognatilysobacter bugurensis TaxID=543356 RepID=A0A918T3S7_9GAMM|nr:YchJ family metal-binding protein [Lysobacter bugurensis]GHA87583.1 UPF0225 protein [Lysobacter bugurensis]
MPACPCSPDRDYAACCAPLHAGQAAPDAAALMRSRYSAYALGRHGYVLDTWHASTRPATLEPDEAVQWLGLDVRTHVADGDRAEVEFVARWRAGGASAQRLHERSRFVREGGRWFYLDGTFIERATRR